MIFENVHQGDLLTYNTSPADLKVNESPLTVHEDHGELLLVRREEACCVGEDYCSLISARCSNID
jgi:hypothetical protein